MEDFSPENSDFYISKFESMLKTNSVFFFDATAFENITHHYMDNGKMALAQKALKLGLEQHPSSVVLQLVKVELLVFDNKLKKAENLLQKLIEIEPSNEEIFIQKANILSKRDKHFEAIEALEMALNYTDNQEDIYALMGMEFLYLDEFEAARLNFAKCLEVDYEDYSSLYNVVYCFEMLQQHDKAINYLKNYIDKDPYSEVAWHQIGRQYFALENYEEALRAFDYAVVIDEYFLGGYLEKAKTLEQLKRYQEAIENYLITLKLADATSFTYLHIGACYEAMGNAKMALKFYDNTVHEDPLLDKGWLAITDLNFIEGNYEKALSSINKALRIDDKNSLYWRKYSQVTLKLNLFEEACLGFKKCIELQDDVLDIWLGYADILVFLGENKEALSLLNDAKKLHKKSVEISYRIACLQFLFKNEMEAFKIFNKALKKDFDYHLEVKGLFPNVFKLTAVQKCIVNFKKV
jgi:tetratricopeptide (TPR) repeat protein